MRVSSVNFISLKDKNCIHSVEKRERVGEQTHAPQAAALVYTRNLSRSVRVTETPKKQTHFPTFNVAFCVSLLDWL